MLCNSVFVSLWGGGGRISLLAKLMRLTRVHTVTFVQSCEIWGTGNYLTQNRKRKSCIWIFNQYSLR